MTVTDDRGRVYVVATPIGNLEDLSARAARVLADEVAVIACEDTRQTAKLCARHGIDTPRVSLHAHNEARRVDGLLERIERGESIALVSDAGTPLVSDPGARLVRAAIDAGLEVVPVPGPSAVTAALVASGLPTRAFAFFGFLPRRGRERRERLAQIAAFPGTAVVYEAPGRVDATLADLHAAAGPRRAAICRELTKRHERVLRGVLGELRIDEPRGEVTLVIEGPPDAAREEPDPAALEARIDALLAAGRSPRDTARLVADETGLPRSDAYARVHARRAAGPPSDPEANKALVRRIYEQGFNRGDASVFDELYAPDFRHHDKSVHDVSPGAEGERESMLRFRAAIPDVCFTIEAQVAEGDLVVNRLLLTGTPVVEFPPLRPEDGPLRRRAVAIFRIVDGRAVEEWFYTAGDH